MKYETFAQMWGFNGMMVETALGLIFLAVLPETAWVLFAFAGLFFVLWLVASLLDF